MTDIGTAVSLLVAVIDLAEVKSIRKGIRANLLARGGVEGPLSNIELPHPHQPQRDFESNIRFDRRPLFDAKPTCLPARIAGRATNVERMPAIPTVAECDAAPAEPHRHGEHGPLVPPWKLPLVPRHACSQPIVKCPPKPPDVMNKGSLLDFFL